MIDENHPRLSLVRRLMRAMGLRSLAPRPNTWRRKTSMSGSPDIGRVAGRSARSVRVHTFAPLAHELHSINNTISIKKEKTKTVQSGSI